MEPEGLRSDANIDLYQSVRAAHALRGRHRTSVLTIHKLLQHETSCVQLVREPNYLDQSAAAGDPVGK